MADTKDPGTLPRFAVPEPYAHLIDRVDVMNQARRKKAMTNRFKIGLKVTGGNPKRVLGPNPFIKGNEYREWQSLILTLPDGRVFTEPCDKDFDGACHKLVGHLESMA